MISVIKATGNNESLMHDLVQAYKEKKDYLRAYVYSVAGNNVDEVARLLKNHIFSMGYKSEKNLFILRAAFEFMMQNRIESANNLIELFWTEEKHEEDEEGLSRIYHNFYKNIIYGIENSDIDFIRIVVSKY